jgi:exodeoxyribonuclease I
MPPEEAPAIATATELGIEELTRRAEFLSVDEAFRTRLVAAFQSTREEPPASPHLERQLYEGFFPREDEALAVRFHEVPWEERPAIVATLTDRRLRKIGQRLIYLERPDLMGDSERSQYDRAIALRIGKDDGDVPWLTLSRAVADLEDLMVDADATEATLLGEYRAHLAARIEMAAVAINVLSAEPASSAA